MDVRTILDQKHKPLTTCRPEDTIEAAATILTANHIGAIPVRDAVRMVAAGIEPEDLRDDLAIDTAGIVTFLGDASKDGAMLLV